MRVLIAERLTLEPQAVEHAEEMFAVLSDPAIYEYENQPPPSVEWIRARFAKLESRWSPDQQQQWLNWVVRLPTSELIGYVQATVGPAGHADIAYEFSSAYWGRGLARQAVEVMIVELAKHYRVGNLSAVLKRTNQRSRRFLERLSFLPALPAQNKGRQIEPDERLMCRAVS